MTSQPIRAHVLALSGLLALAATSVAQVPLDYLVTAEAPTVSGYDGWAYVDPSTGVATRVEMANGKLLGPAVNVAVDTADKNGIYTSAGFSIGGAPVLRLDMAGNLIVNRGGGSLQTFGRMGRILVRGKTLYFTLSTGSQQGLHAMPFFNASPPRVVALADAFDIAEIQGKIYISSFASGKPSTIIEYDPATQQSRTVGSSYPTIHGLGTLGAFLIAGTTGGDLLRILPANGVSAPFLQTGKGDITAVVEGPQPGVVHFATANDDIWVSSNLSTPVYQAPGTLHDIDVGVVDQGAFLIFGDDCASTQAGFVHKGGADLGQPFTLEVQNAPAQTSAVLFLGSSRQRFGAVPLPLDLGPAMPGCTLYTDIVGILALATNAQGVATAAIPIPSQSTLQGLHFMAQYCFLEPQANALDLTTSDAGEAIIR